MSRIREDSDIGCLGILITIMLCALFGGYVIIRDKVDKRDGEERIDVGCCPCTDAGGPDGH